MKREYRYRVWVAETLENKKGGMLDNVDYSDFDDLRDALYEVADFIKSHGGVDCWDDFEGRLSSCWMDYRQFAWDVSSVEPGEMQVSYQVWVTQDKMVQQADGKWKGVESELRLTLKRLEPYLS